MKLSGITAGILLSIVGLFPVAALAICGDGIIEYRTEQCDDGNLSNGDSCSALCRSESGRHHVPVCGDNRVSGVEECDGAAGCNTQCEFDFAMPTTVDVNACGTLSRSNVRYQLTRDLSSSGDCIVLKAENIEFDGQDFEIDSGGVGIHIEKWNRRNVVIRNVKITTTGIAGITGRSVRGALISNVSVRNSGVDDLSNGANVIDFQESTQIVLERCILENGVKENRDRNYYSGASVKLGEDAIIRNCVFIGTPQNGLRAESGTHLFNNYANGGTEIRPGDRSVGHTNNFFVGAWDSSDMNINNNVIVNAGYFAEAYELSGQTTSGIIDEDLPYLLRHHLTGEPTQRPKKIIAGRPQNRGIFGMDGTSPQQGIAIYNNYSSSYGPANNEEYGGCQLGGASGIHLESIVHNSFVFANTMVAVAAECDADAAKPSSITRGAPNIWSENQLVAVKVERDAGAGVGDWPGMSVAVDLRESMPGTIFTDNSFSTLVIDSAGRQLDDAATGGDDVSLWRLLSRQDADGFVFENSYIDMSRTPNQRLLSVARTWTDRDGDAPAAQTISWRNVRFKDAASERLFTDQIESVYSGWDIRRGLSEPRTFPQVRVIVDSVRGNASITEPTAPRPPVLLD